jgi:hypothetical protein
MTGLFESSRGYCSGQGSVQWVRATAEGVGWSGGEGLVHWAGQYCGGRREQAFCSDGLVGMTCPANGDERLSREQAKREVCVCPRPKGLLNLL